MHLDLGPALSFIADLGGEIADVIQLISSNSIGAFLLGIYVIATFVRGVWVRVRKG